MIHPSQCFGADLEENNMSFINKNLEVVENIYLAICLLETLVVKDVVKDLHTINQRRAY